MPTNEMDACPQWCRSYLANDVQVLNCGLVGVIPDDRSCCCSSCCSSALQVVLELLLYPWCWRSKELPLLTTFTPRLLLAKGRMTLSFDQHHDTAMNQEQEVHT